MNRLATRFASAAVVVALLSTTACAQESSSAPEAEPALVPTQTQTEVPETEPVTEPPTAQASGIIACGVQDPTAVISPYTLEVLDPVSGTTLETLLTFPVRSAESAYTAVVLCTENDRRTVSDGGSAITSRFGATGAFLPSFARDLRYLPATAESSDGTGTAVGQVDSSTDEFETLFETKESFEAPAAALSNPIFSLDGAWLYYAQDETTVWRVSTTPGGTPQQVGKYPGEPFVVGPGGEIIPYPANQLSLSAPLGTRDASYVMKTSLGGPGSGLYEDGSLVGYEFRWYATPQGPRVIPADTQTDYPVDGLRSCTYGSGQLMVCIRDETNEVVTFDASRVPNVEPRTLVPASDRDIWNLVVSPDGQTLLFQSSRQDRRGVYSVPISGGEPKELPGFAPEGFFVGWR